MLERKISIMKKVSSKILALIMAVAMLFSLAAPAFAAADAHQHDDIKYVSIGDSMTNGYGFEGYEQGTDAIDFFNGVGVYGEGSYALQFEDYLKQYGDVEHTKLAVSALRAEDLLYLLGGRDMPTDGWFDQVLHYSGENADALAAYYQAAVKDADIITLGIGNASFGAYMVQYITRAMGVMGGSLDPEEVVTLDMALELLESEEAREVVRALYDTAMEELSAIIPADLAAQYKLTELCDAIAYIAAGFLINYEGVVDKIVELNPDVEIMLIGLMNTTYGMEITAEGMEPIAIGSIMDNLFGLLNAYIAGVPTAKQLAGEYPEATFYYAAQPQPKFIVQAFDDLAANDWNNVDDGRLSGKVVRERSLKAYNNDLRPMIGLALGFALPAVTISDVTSYELREYTSSDDDQYQVTIDFQAEITAYETEKYLGTRTEGDLTGLPLMQKYISKTGDVSFDNVASNFATVFAAEIEKEISTVIYLALEASIVASVDTMEITLDGLMGIAGGDIFGALGDMPEELSNNPGPGTIYKSLCSWFTGTETSRAMCKIYGLFKIGDGMSVHPTPSGHDDLFKVIVNSYESEYTAQDETIKNLAILADLIKEYYDEAYVIAYQQAVAAGVIDLINAYLDEAEASVDGAKAWVDQYAEYIRSNEFAAQLDEAFASADVTIAELRDLINSADALDAESYAKALELLDALIANVENIGELLAIAVVDAGEYLDPIILALEAQAQAQITTLNAQLEAEIAAINAQLKAQVDYQLAILNAELAALNAELQTAVGEAEVAIRAEIARVEAEIAALIAEAQVQLDAAIAEAQKAYDAAVVAVQQQLDAAILAAEQGLDAALAELEVAIAALNDAAAAALEAAIAEVEAIVAIADAKVNGLVKAIYEALDLGYNATVDTLKMIEAIIGAIRNYIAGIVSGEITLTEDTFYLAIVDGDDGYADIIAEALNLDADQYKKVTMGEATAEDIARADLITVGYNGASAIDFAFNQALGFAKEYINVALRASANAYIADAVAKINLIKDPAAVAENLSAKLNEELDAALAAYLGDAAVSEMDWAALVGEENLSYVADALDAIDAALTEAGVVDVFSQDIDVAALVEANADMLGEYKAYVDLIDLEMLLDDYTLEIPVGEFANFVAESALYAYTAYNLEYCKTMLMIGELNADAAVAALGNYNRIDLDYLDYEIVLAEFSFTLADVFAALGYDGVEIPNEAFAALGALAAVEEYTFINPAIELTAYALAEYYALADYALTIELPACAEAEAMINDLVAACNACVGGFAGAIIETETITVAIPGDAIVALIIEGGHNLDALINASITTKVVLGGEALEIGDTLDLIAAISSLHPFAYALQFANVFYVDISDAKVGGAEYIAAQVLAALTVNCDHLYDDCEDAICNICGGERVPVGHSFTDYVSNNDATCTQDGTKTAICDNGCGKTDTVTDAGSMTAHNYVYVSNGDATCGADGTKTGTCACGATVIVDDAGSATGAHNYVYVSNNDATCTQDGTKTGTCACGDVVTVTDTGSAKGHTFGDYVSNGDATCTADGTKTRTCVNGCGAAETVTDAGSATGHSFGNYVSNNNATCTQDGTKTRTCACGETDTVVDTGSAKGHSYGEWETVKEATKKEAGERKQTCSRCGDVITEAIPMLEGGAKVGLIVAISAASTAVAGGAGAAFYFIRKRRI